MGARLRGLNRRACRSFEDELTSEVLYGAPISGPSRDARRTRNLPSMPQAFPLWDSLL
jgi:hypothetical protein